MTEELKPVKCRCVREAIVVGRYRNGNEMRQVKCSPHSKGHVKNRVCGWAGPMELNSIKAIQAWNDVMEVKK